MNSRLLGRAALLGTIMSIATITRAGEFEQAVQQANMALDQANAVNYEWRDSRAILKEAIEVENAGDYEAAMKLVEQARMQGIIATAQAGREKNPRLPR